MAVTVTFFSESPGSACHKYRVRHVVEALKGHPTIRARYSEKWDQAVRGSDILFFQRNSNHGAAKLMLALASEQRTMIYDMDDDIFQIPLSNPIFPLYYNADPEHPDVSILARQVLGMRLSTAVTVSSDRLLEVYAGINPKVCLLPNCVKLSEWENVQPLLTPSADTVRVFWGGSPTHEQDLKLMEAVFPELSRRFGSRIEIVIMGDDSVSFPCPTLNIPYGSYTFFQRVMLSCQIGIAPMEEDLFNRAKSDLRLKEMGCAGLAIVASSVGEYAKAGDFAVLCASTEDWVEALSTLVRDTGQRDFARRASRVWVEGWDISNKIGLWVDLFEELYDHNRRSTGKTVSVRSATYTPHILDGGKVRVGR